MLPSNSMAEPLGLGQINSLQIEVIKSKTKQKHKDISNWICKSTEKFKEIKKLN